MHQQCHRQHPVSTSEQSGAQASSESIKHRFTLAMLIVTPAAHWARFQPLPDSLMPYEMSPCKEGEAPGTSPALCSPWYHLSHHLCTHTNLFPAHPAPHKEGAHEALLLTAAERGEGRCTQPKLGAR